METAQSLQATCSNCGAVFSDEPRPQSSARPDPSQKPCFVREIYADFRGCEGRTLGGLDHGLLGWSRFLVELGIYFQEFSQVECMCQVENLRIAGFVSDG